MRVSLLLRYPLLLLLLAGACAAPPDSAPAEEAAAEVTRGTADAISARAVGYLAKVIDGGGIDVKCAAVLVEPSKALAMRRCVEASAEHSGLAPLDDAANADLRVGFGQVRGTEPGEPSSLRAVRHVHGLQGFADRYLAELAVLELAPPAPGAAAVPPARIEPAEHGETVRVVTYDSTRRLRPTRVGHKTERTARLARASLNVLEGYSRSTGALEDDRGGYCNADVGAAVVQVEKEGGVRAATVLHGFVFLSERDASLPDCSKGRRALFARADGPLADFVARTWVQEGGACGPSARDARCAQDLECRDAVCVTP